jgi:hypothetical protein
MQPLSEDEKIAQLDRLLRTYIPTMNAERRRALIAVLPLYLWSIYGGRPTK